MKPTKRMTMPDTEINLGPSLSEALKMSHQAPPSSGANRPYPGGPPVTWGGRTPTKWETAGQEGVVTPSEFNVDDMLLTTMGLGQMAKGAYGAATSMHGMPLMANPDIISQMARQRVAAESASKAYMANQFVPGAKALAADMVKETPQEVIWQMPGVGPTSFPQPGKVSLNMFGPKPFNPGTGAINPQSNAVMYPASMGDPLAVNSAWQLRPHSLARAAFEWGNGGYGGVGNPLLKP